MNTVNFEPAVHRNRNIIFISFAKDELLTENRKSARGITVVPKNIPVDKKTFVKSCIA
jgi:hypothetical protein